MTDLSDRLASISPEQRALLFERLQKRRQPSRGVIPSLGRESRVFPLSFAQERLWFIEQLEPGTALYNIPFAVRLAGPLDRPALQRSLAALAARHEPLRTSLPAIEREPVQRIADPGRVALPWVDLSGLEAGLRRHEGSRVLAEEARRPFRLDRGPLFRASLVVLGEAEHDLLLTLHHAISDGWSQGVLLRDLARLYAAEVTGTPPDLRALPIQHADFAAWQRHWLQGEGLSALLAYWRRRLDGAPAVLELPADRPRPAVRSPRGVRLSRRLPQPLGAALKSLGQSADATPFMTLLAVYAVLLYRSSGQGDLLVGTPVAGRAWSEVEDLVGLFVNSLVLRCEVPGGASFRAWLRQLRSAALEDFQHQSLPFEKLVAELQPQRALSHNPLFQVAFLLRAAEEREVRAGGVAFTAREVPTGTAKLDLTLGVIDEPEGLRVELEYAVDLFDEATAARLLGHLGTLLEGLAADPEGRVSELPLLTPAEREQLRSWRGEAVEYPRESCIHELFSAAATRRPEAVAVVSGGESLTYGALERRANRLARLLARLGVGPEVPVGLCLPRSLDAVVAMLAVLKSGGAYLPLDPGHPRQRLAHVLGETGPPVVLTLAALRGVLPAPSQSHAFRVICLDASAEEIGRESAEPLASATVPDSLAYILYTSGSTGQPKGVGIVHRGVVRLARGAGYARLDEGEVILQLAPLVFDAATFEIWGALLNGCRLVVFPPHVPTLDELATTLVAEGVTTVLLVTGLFHQMAEGRSEGLRSLRHLLVGGEALAAAPARRVLEEFPDLALTNAYGPTENTVISCYHPLSGSASVVDPVPVGRAIRNSTVHLLAAGGQLAPVGVSGELCVGGDGLARGYVGRPDLTAERFVPNPFAESPGERLYRTGDLTRFRPDGAIEFLGRIDRQVKVRGFRIELGEVESALGGCAGVASALVEVRREALVGYFVPAPGTEVTVEALRSALREKLPEYMVPTALVRLDALPLTSSGKVNREALPEPQAEAGGNGEPFAAPRGPVEEGLASLWCELLGLARVGVHDDFFALGGHSLMATRLLSRVRDAFRAELPLRAFFAEPTVAGLARRVEAARRGGRAPLEPPVPVPRLEPPPLSFAQQRLWFLDQFEAAGMGYTIPLAVRLRGPLDTAALAAAFTWVTGRHEILRTSFPERAGRPVQAVAPAAPFRLPEEDLGGLPDAVAERQCRQRAAEEVRLPFDLAAGAPLRARLFRRGADDCVLVVCLHHIAADGWSAGLFWRELATAYGAFARGSSAPLEPPPALQYGDYAVWQRRWLSGTVLDELIASWKARLAGAPAALELPADRPRPAVQTHHGADFAFSLPLPLSRSLAGLAVRGGATPFMVLLAGFSALLSRAAGCDDLLVGTPVAGRHLGELESLMGLCINNLVLRADLSGDPDFPALLGRVRETALAAYDDQHLPFERLVEELLPQRELSHAPLFQVMFSLQNMPPFDRDLPGLAAERWELAAETAQFDLTLALREVDGALAGGFNYNTDLLDRPTVARGAGHFATLLAAWAERPETRLAALPLLSEAEAQQILREWSDTQVATEPDACLHDLFAAQAARTPAAPAVVFGGAAWSFRELDERTNRLAYHLRRLGVGPDVTVGLFLERSLEMVAGMLAVLKAGGAYLPLDPAYPEERLLYLIADAQAPVVLTQERLLAHLPAAPAHVLCLDRDRQSFAGESAAPLAAEVTADNLAYLIYTSGSTGRPKGVMVSHRSVVNFFVGMDPVLGGGEPGTWLALTSISFDISVLELLWTLCRGFAVVVQPDRQALMRSAGESLPAAEPAERAVDFSLFYFASAESGPDKYRLLLEGARFADRNGLTAVWTPERHFHPFGGLYPNPAVAGAALAAVTERVQIRAGSVVLPLHHPLRVAEEWALVDNLSRGRVGISFASGWHAADFALAPERYHDRKAVMLREIETVRRLWRGEVVGATDGTGRPIEVRVYPRPVQPELPVWVTAGGHPETFRMAAEAGANLLTHLLAQDLDDLKSKIGIYRRARHEAGHDRGHVTLMVHAFLGDDLESVRDIVRRPFCDYLRSSFGLLSGLLGALRPDLDIESLAPEELDLLLERAFDRFYATAGLLGTRESCLPMVDRLRGIGVDEIACLIDFGIDTDTVLGSLDRLVDLMRDSRRPRARDEGSIGLEISRRGASHFQCTPSMAALLALEPDALRGLGGLRRMLVGGEALPPALARTLAGAVSGEVHNMYGPTETTVWSATDRVEAGRGVTIGRPIANTALRVLDPHLSSQPTGVPGEIFIGGQGVTRGYLRRPDVTAERFLPDPFVGDPGARLYRTGDVGRFLPDGRLQFLGRADRQVKVRGFRIELGEIEALLAEHPAVREAVVVLRDGGGDGEKKLVAYCVTGTAVPSPSPDAERILAGKRRFRLPNGMTVATLSDFQANVGYREIFASDVYLRHGIELEDGACVFDVGANIGFFSLLVQQRCRNPVIYACEPIPPILEVLQANLELYGVRGEVLGVGLGERPDTSSFVFYPQMPGLSGRHSASEKDKRDMRSILDKWLGRQGARGAGRPDAAEIEELLDERFASETYTCPVVTLSDLIAEHNIERIDLLKIDVEKSELEVLHGLRAEDWPKVRQMVLEVDNRENLDAIVALLVERGYDYAVEDLVRVEASEAAPEVSVFAVYARRWELGGLSGDLAGGLSGVLSGALAAESPETSAAEIQAFLRARLPDYEVPAVVVLLAALPRTPNGKLDRRALPSPDEARPTLGADYAPPQTEAQGAIATVWQEILRLDRVGIDDNFFELGGTSFSIIQARSRLRELLGESVSIIDMFRFPTVRSLAAHLAGQGAAGAPEAAPAAVVADRVSRQRQAFARQRRNAEDGRP
jgi:natural product biosynthesis luciferase-like monooxygenase protein/amino acid adenylation domain-containing protein/FkbM family methyltransferase